MSPNSSKANGRNFPGRALPPGSVVLEGVTKRFRKLSVRKRGYTTVKSRFLGKLWGRSMSRTRELVVLRDFDLSITPGAAIGIIGRNGSGKSTLLKLITGIYRPDAGKVSVSGKVSALIELGAGFHPEFSGRENVYLGGAMYGMSRREIDKRFDAIVRYAELEEFIDDPVRTYSSGMYMRLGFSVAICCDPDILLIDEVLAVGDAGFVHRCFDSISEFKRRGKTLILVTHDLDAVVRWCDEAIWLDKGRIQKRGEPQWVVDSYLAEVLKEEERVLEAEQPSVEATEEEQHRWGNRDVEITRVQMRTLDGDSKWIFGDGEGVEVAVNYQLMRPVQDLVFGVGILRVDGLVVHGTNTQIDDLEVPLPRREDHEIVVDADGRESFRTPVAGEYRYRIQRLGLLEGSYYLDVAAHDSEGTPFDYHHRLYKFSVRSGERAHGVYNPEHSWSFSSTGVSEQSHRKAGNR